MIWTLLNGSKYYSKPSILSGPFCAQKQIALHMKECFNTRGRGSNGSSLPSWLLSPGPAYLKRGVRQSKYEPLVDEMELLHAIPMSDT